MRTYKINGKEIEAMENYDKSDFQTWDKVVVSKYNQLLEALSDKEEPKQEEWKGCGVCNCKYPQFCEGCYKADYKCRVCDNEPKQSTSLKEEAWEIIDRAIMNWDYRPEGSLITRTEHSKILADKILKLLQSHLIKEITDNAEYCCEEGCSGGYDCEKDIIKIINNIK